MNDDMEKDIITIISDHLGAPKSDIHPQAKFIDDLGADSLDTVELVMALEEKFDIEITDQEAETIQTVGAAIELIQGKAAKTV